MEDLSEFLSDALGASIGFSEEQDIKTSSIRLKSAIKQWGDYMKNRNLKRQADYLLSEFEATVLQDSTGLLGEVWKICLEPSSSAFNYWVESNFPSYGHEHMDVFKAEVNMLLGGAVPERLEGLYSVTRTLKEYAPSLLSVASFLIFCVSLDCVNVGDTVAATWPIKMIKDVIWSKHSSEFSVGVYESMTLIRFQRSLFLVHRDHLLNLCDKINERMNILIFHMLSPRLSDDQSIPISLFLWLFRWGDRVKRKYLSRGFLLLSNYEALIVGLILRQGDNCLWDTHHFLNSVVNDVVNELEGSKSMIQELLDHLYSLTPHQLCDIHGLYRIWGHPEVILREGLQKMMDNSLTIKTPRSDLLLHAIYSFREIFCCNYYKIHRHYPALEISWEEEETPLGTPYLIRQILASKHIDKKHSGYDVTDWKHILLGKNFEVPATWNLAHNIKDKAISPDRDELFSSVRKGQGVIIQEYRRTVLKWLKRDMTPMREFLNAIDVEGLKQNSCIIGLYAKERELKLLPRFFSLMSFEMRLYFVSTEQLLSDNVLKYFPQITMTANLLEMTKKILSMSSQLSDKGQVDDQNPISQHRKSVSYTINIDFKKWNQQMRYSVTEGVFRELDNLFGFQNCFRRTHGILGSSLIYLCSGEHTPQLSGNSVIEEKPWNWSGDESGKEGLRQKGWTIMTVAMIEYVMREHDVKYELIGGGDNQVLVVTLNSTLVDLMGELTDEGKAEIKERMEMIVKSLDDYFGEVGLPLKLNETWVSAELFMYNKLMCYKGRMLRSVSKTVSRTFPFSDDAAITLSGMSSSIGTSIKSISTRDFGHMGAYIFSRWLALWVGFICYHAHPLLEGGLSSVAGAKYRYSIQGNHVQDTCPGEAITVMTLVNSLLFHHRILGGASLGVPSDWVMRGFPDPLTTALAWNLGIIRRMWLKGTLYRFIKAVTSVSKRAGAVNYLHLVSDPVAVNHDGPISGLAALREISEKAITNSSEITNTSFKELATLCHSEASRGLINSMVSSNILEPRYLHDIFGSTLYGYFNSIVSRVDKSMTIIRLNRKTKVMNQILEREIEMIAYLMDRWRRDYDLSCDRESCSRETADHYRRVTWGKHIVGVTVPSPTECFSTFSEHLYEGCDDNYIIVSTLPHDDPLTTRGPLEPYLGSYTDEKFKLSPIAGAFGEEELLSKAIHLQKLRHWRYREGSDLYNLVRDVLISETDLNPDSLFVFLESSSSSTHRYADAVLSHGAILNTIPDLYRWYSISSTTLSQRSRGGRNDLIHFQASFLWISSLMVNRDLRGLFNPDTVHFHETCDRCIIPVIEVDDQDVQLNVSWSLPRLMTNTVAYVKSSDIYPSYANRILIKKYETSMNLHVIVPEGEADELATDAISQGLLLAATGAEKYSQSNINSMGNITLLREVMRKLSGLCSSYCAYYGKPVKFSRLSSIVCCQPFCRLLQESQVQMTGISMNQPRQSGTDTMVRNLLSGLAPSCCKYLTNMKIDPKYFMFMAMWLTDYSLQNCTYCKDSLLNTLSASVPPEQYRYGCGIHVIKQVPKILMSMTDAYSASKSYRDHGCRSSMIRPPPEFVDVENYWSSVTSSSANDPDWSVPSYGGVSEYLSTRELYGLYMALGEAMRILRVTGEVEVIFDQCWEYAILSIILSKQYVIPCHLSTFLSPLSNSGSEYNGMIGLQSFLYNEDKGMINLGQSGRSSTLESENQRVQIVTGGSGKIQSCRAYVFPLSSGMAVKRIKDMTLYNNYILWYPRKSVDRAVWCLALKSESRKDSLHSLYTMRENLRRRTPCQRMRHSIDRSIEGFKYPLLMSHGLVNLLPELGDFVEPKHRLDMITNAQILIRKLNKSDTRRGIELQGRDKMCAYLFLALLSLSMGHINGRLLIQKVHSVLYYPDSEKLVIKRKRSDNVMILSIVELISDQMLVARIRYDITGRNCVFLSQSKEAGVHIYPIF